MHTPILTFTFPHRGGRDLRTPLSFTGKFRKTSESFRRNRMKLLVISGGRHPYEESTPVLEQFLTAAGHAATVTEDASVLADADAMAEYDALVFNTLREGELVLSNGEQGRPQGLRGRRQGVRVHSHRGLRSRLLGGVPRRDRRRVGYGEELPSAL